MAQKMNEIESLFFKAYEDNYGKLGLICDVEPQVKIGKYRIDFEYAGCAVEIDGQEWHKTKEQRKYDYQRERFLIQAGYVPIRFTASEIYHDPIKCIMEMHEVAMSLEMERVRLFILARGVE